MSNHTLSVTRRHWLAGCARGAVLSGMGAAAGLLVLRGQLQACALPADHCPGCNAWNTCTLPAAALARHSQPSAGSRLEADRQQEVES